MLVIEDELFRNLVEESNSRKWVLQPYIAIMSESDCPTPEKTDGFIGHIENEHRVSHFSIIFSVGSQKYPIFPNTIYLTNTIIRQLQLNLKQRVDVFVQSDTCSSDLCDVNLLTFYTFVQVFKIPFTFTFSFFIYFYFFLSQDYDLKELEKDVKMWLPSVAKSDTKLIFNHGQHFDIPCLIKNKTNRLFVGISSKKKEVQFCQLDEDAVEKLLDKVKVIRINSKNAPKFLQLLYDSDDLQLDPYHNLGRIGYTIIFIVYLLHFEIVMQSLFFNCALMTA